MTLRYRLSYLTLKISLYRVEVQLQESLPPIIVMLDLLTSIVLKCIVNLFFEVTLCCRQNKGLVIL